MSRLFILICLCVSCAAKAIAADPPDPCVTTTLDGVGRLLLIPDEDGADPHPMGSFTVTVKNYDCQPIYNAVVEVIIGGQATNKTKLCGSAVTVKLTDHNGNVTFNIPGGGCYRGADAVVIRANGVIVRNFYAVMSPDYAGWDNSGMANRWSLSITPVDLAAFVAAYQGGTGPASCHDYDNSGVTDPRDLAVFASTYSGGTRDCSP